MFSKLQIILVQFSTKFFFTSKFCYPYLVLEIKIRAISFVDIYLLFCIIMLYKGICETFVFAISQYFSYSTFRGLLSATQSSSAFVGNAPTRYSKGFAHRTHAEQSLSSVKFPLS